MQRPLTTLVKYEPIFRLGGSVRRALLNVQGALRPYRSSNGRTVGLHFMYEKLPVLHTCEYHYFYCAR